MSKIQYRAALQQLGLTQVAAAELLGVGPRTSRRWALGEQPVPKVVALLLRLMLELKLSPEAARRVHKKIRDS